MNAGSHSVHIRVNDLETKQPTPFRLHIARLSGEYLAPFGRLTEFDTLPGKNIGGNLVLDSRRYAYIDGTCEIELPADAVEIRISKGLEYVPIEKQISVGPGKLALRFNLERWTNLRKQGWYSGDMRAHYLSPHAALLEGSAEDLAVVNVLAFEADAEKKSVPGILEFSGQKPALETAGHLVAVNTFNRHPVLGSLSLLHCHRVVYPLRSGSPGLDDWTLADWCGQCHRKAGLVVWSEVAGWPERGGEALANLLLGQVDAFEVIALDEAELPLWYDLLEVGVHVPLVGASAKDSNALQLGVVRTYAHLGPGQELTYKTWIEAVRASRTFVTEGPLLDLTVEGQGPGSRVELADGSHSVRIAARAQSIVDFDKLELLHRGVVIASAAATESPLSAAIDHEWSPEESGWLAARCVSATGKVVAHTSAIMVTDMARPFRANPAAINPLMKSLATAFHWVQHEANFKQAREREKLTEIFDSARALLKTR